MPSNKSRVYVALYARGGTSKMPGGEDTYHWALIVGPKVETEGARGVRYHAKEMLTPAGTTEFFFDETSCSLAPTQMLLIRVVVGKVENNEQLVSVLRKVPIKQRQDGWNCVSWVKEALEELGADGKAVGTSVTEWNLVRDAAMGYIQKKKAQRRFETGSTFDMRKVPTYDLIEQRETIP